MLRQTIVALLGCVAAGGAGAQLLPDSYSMPNGDSGTYHYWDDRYNGSGCITCDGAPLTGGTGNLTDGVIATQNWNFVEPPGNSRPYVGWNIDPTITFHWNAPVNIDAVTLWLDDADGFGQVSPPSSITINGMLFPVADPPGPAPFAFTASGLSFSGTDLAVTLTRSNSWVFLSEVQFTASSIPEPESYMLLLAGLSVFGLRLARRKRRFY